MKVLVKNKSIACVLAIFFGTVGIHHFYMGEWKKGLLYLLFFWTGLPTLLGLLDGAKYISEVVNESNE